jgi:hypothetical protein
VGKITHEAVAGIVPLLLSDGAARVRSWTCRSIHDRLVATTVGVYRVEGVAESVGRGNA